jgi:phosphoglycolate phosphatase-like HAD superfamily hydrolase
MTVLDLFDIDGTLLHARSAGRAALDAVFAELLGVGDASAGIRFGGKTDPAIIDDIFAARRGRPATDEERAAVLAAYLPRLRAELAQGGVEVGHRERDVPEQPVDLAQPPVGRGVAARRCSGTQARHPETAGGCHKLSGAWIRTRQGSR